MTKIKNRLALEKKIGDRLGSFAYVFCIRLNGYMVYGLDEGASVI